MIAIFYNINDAQKVCDMIQEYLTENRQSYSASLWDTPHKSDTSEKYYVSLPEEYQNETLKYLLSEYLYNTDVTENVPDGFFKAVEFNTI